MPAKPTMKKLPTSQPAPEKNTLLAICPNQEDRQSLKNMLDRDRWTIQGAPSIGEAITLLDGGPSLILCEKELPDGTWKDAFRRALDLNNPPPFVVVSRLADERLWAEVLNLGGFDVLLKPFETSEVRRLMSMALRHANHLSAYAM